MIRERMRDDRIILPAPFGMILMDEFVTQNVCSRHMACRDIPVSTAHEYTISASRGVSDDTWSLMAAVGIAYDRANTSHRAAIHHSSDQRLPITMPVQMVDDSLEQ